MAEDLLQWVAMAVLTAATAFALLAPLGRRRAAGAPAAADIAIYRDQLAETERDTARGVILPEEAEAARLEIARRVLRAGAAADAGSAGEAPSPFRLRLAGFAVLVFLPVAAVAAYVVLGSPGDPDRPLAARLAEPVENAEFAVLVRRVEEHLAGAPEDGEGWQVIAPAYVGLGRYDDAAAAYRNAIRILGSGAELQAALGQTLVMQAEGMVTAEAQAAFEAARAAKPAAPAPRYYLALALTQEGKRDEAIAAWRALLADAPAGAPWAAAAEDQLAALAGSAPAADPAPGPDAAEIAAAASMGEGERQAMIEGMVASLAARLQAEPGDADGWARLIRSYMVLGRQADAAAALDAARAALTGRPERLAAVEAAARELHLIP